MVAVVMTLMLLLLFLLIVLLLRLVLLVVGVVGVVVGGVVVVGVVGGVGVVGVVCVVGVGVGAGWRMHTSHSRPGHSPVTCGAVACRRRSSEGCSGRRRRRRGWWRRLNERESCCRCGSLERGQLPKLAGKPELSIQGRRTGRSQLLLKLRQARDIDGKSALELAAANNHAGCAAVCQLCLALKSSKT